MNEVIIRTLRFEGKKFWLTSVSSNFYRWGNCLYLHFNKEDFPEIKSPPIVDCDWFAGKKTRRFDYDKSPLANHLDWHGGCTFYEETTVVESGKTYVKIGCDYSHFMDDEYMSRDCGKMILEVDGKKIVDEFEKYYESIKK